jgi:hypothetical protein
MSQNRFTLSFPLRSPVNAKAVAEQLPPLMPRSLEAEDPIGTNPLLALHFCSSANSPRS